MLSEEDLTAATLANATEELYHTRKRYVAAMKQDGASGGVDAVLAVIRPIVLHRFSRFGTYNKSIHIHVQGGLHGFAYWQ